MPVQSLLKRPLRQLRRTGLRVGASAVAKRALSSWMEWGTLLFFSRDLATVVEQPAIPGISVRVVRGPELPFVARALGRPSAAFLDRFDRGGRCFGAFDGLRPVHCCWVGTGPEEIPEVGLWLCPKPGEAFAYEAVTAGNWRGVGVARTTWGAIERTLREEGHRRLFGFVQGDQHSQQRQLPPEVTPLTTLRYLRLPGEEAYRSGCFGSPLFSSREQGEAETREAARSRA